MNFKKLVKEPKNPQHFIAMCFIEARVNPSIKTKNQFMKKVGMLKGNALFSSAYGYFWVSKERKFSSSFFMSKEEAVAGRIWSTPSL